MHGSITSGRYAGRHRLWSIKSRLLPEAFLPVDYNVRIVQQHLGFSWLYAPSDGF